MRSLLKSALALKRGRLAVCIVTRRRETAPGSSTTSFVCCFLANRTCTPSWTSYKIHLECKISHNCKRRPQRISTPYFYGQTCGFFGGESTRHEFDSGTRHNLARGQIGWDTDASKQQVEAHKPHSRQERRSLTPFPSRRYSVQKSGQRTFQRVTSEGHTPSEGDYC